MKVQALMSRNVVSFDKNRSVKEALDLFSQKGVSRIPVTEHGKLVGIITLSDMLKVLGSSRTKASPSHVHLSNIVNRRLIVVNDDHDISDAAELMLRHGISALPVVDDDSLIGMLTKSDLLRACAENKAKISELMVKPITVSVVDRIVHARKIIFDENISMLPVVDSGRLVGIVTEGMIAKAMGWFKKAVQKHQASKITQMVVEDIMSQDISSLSPDSTVGEAASLLLQKRRRSLPVVDNGRLIGVISETDLITVLR